MAPREFLPFRKGEGNEFVERRSEANILQDKIRLYELVLGRYRQMIEHSESKTIADLKAMIRPNDETVQKAKEEITSAMRPYIYDQHFDIAAEAAHKTVREMRTVKSLIDFWLTPKEMMNLRGGDPMDKAVFLCSLLIALDNPDSYVIVGVDSGIKVAVGYKFGEQWRLLDTTSKASVSGDKETLLKEWFGDERNIYEFNNIYYNQLKGEE
ncbi:Uncharacterised protein [uncultured archaeon]|nr:Uncharacterised protein [uncultured archaeon]